MNYCGWRDTGPCLEDGQWYVSQTSPRHIIVACGYHKDLLEKCIQERDIPMWCDYQEKGAGDCPTPYYVIGFENEFNYYVFCALHIREALQYIEKEIEKGSVIAYEDRDTYQKLLDMIHSPTLHSPTY